CSINLCRM
ncbi:HDOD domain protein, partial [Vibrio parahaemolyticus V-223/04]